jgi:CHASE3 domain sensor protein
MDQHTFQRLLRRTVALPVVLLVLLAAVLVIEILLLSISLRWVDHSDQVISTARQLQRQVIQMETGLRGYYLTGDLSFLDSNDAKSKVPEQAKDLLSLTSDNPSQQQRLKEVRDVDDRWI